MDGSLYVPVNRFTGAEGPAYEYFTLAAFWIATQPQSVAWRVAQVSG